MSDFRSIPGSPWKVKLHGDGQATVRRVGSVKKTWDRNATRRKLKPSQMDTKGMAGRMIGSMPEDVHKEMVDTYGNDSDAHKAFLRDHPNFATVSRNNVGASSRKLTFGPMSHIPKAEWDRIFHPEEDKT